MTCGLAPGHAWSRCGGYLPRSCAAEVTVTRRRWTGERITTIRDRQNEPERQAHGGPGLEAEAEL